MNDPLRVGWLRCLIATYDQEHDWEADPDQTATREMLRECRELLAELEAGLPPVEMVEPMDATGLPW